MFIEVPWFFCFFVFLDVTRLNLMTKFWDSWKGFYALFALPYNSMSVQEFYATIYYSLRK